MRLRRINNNDSEEDSLLWSQFQERMSDRKISQMTDKEVLQEQLKWCNEYLRLCTIREDQLKRRPEEYRQFLVVEQYTRLLQDETRRRNIRQPD